jgi:hypothetical protein
MAIIENTYVGDGSTVLYSFTFPYIDPAHVKVSLDGSDTTAYSLANATTVEMDTAPGVGVDVRVYRVTDDAALTATFYPGSAIRAADLNDNMEQVLFIVQEVRAFSESTDAADVALVAQDALDTANEAVTTAGNALVTADAADATASGLSSAVGSAQATADAAMPKAGGTFTGDVTFSAGLACTGSGALVLPVGSSAARPGTPSTGMIRYNSNITQFEGYNGAVWGTIGGGAKGAGTDQVFFENDQTVTTSYSITAGKNAVTAGPVTIDTGITVTVPSGSSWSIV